MKSSWLLVDLSSALTQKSSYDWYWMSEIAMYEVEFIIGLT